MDWGNNIYYDAEKHGLVTIAAIDDAESCYSFDLTVVWKNPETGEKYWASDSGCSCPSPFELIQSVDGLTPLKTDTDWDRLVAHVMGYGRRTYPLADVNRFLAQAKES